jgi:hypothetical protein
VHLDYEETVPRISDGPEVVGVARYKTVTLTMMATAARHVGEDLRRAHGCSNTAQVYSTAVGAANQLQRSGMSIAARHDDGQAPEERHVGICGTLSGHMPLLRSLVLKRVARL